MFLPRGTVFSHIHKITDKQYGIKWTLNLKNADCLNDNSCTGENVDIYKVK